MLSNLAASTNNRQDHGKALTLGQRAGGVALADNVVGRQQFARQIPNLDWIERASAKFEWLICHAAWLSGFVLRLNTSRSAAETMGMAPNP